MQVSDSDSMSRQPSVTSSAKMILGSTALKQNQRQEGSGRIIRRILSNKDLRQSQLSRTHSEQQIQTSNQEKEKRPPRPSHVQLITKGMNGAPEDRTGVNDSHVSIERQETHVRHKDKPDRGLWASFSNGGHDSLVSSSSSQVDSYKGILFFCMYLLNACMLILCTWRKGDTSENHLCLNVQGTKVVYQ